MKGPRFFCEGCGAEVPLTAKQCPRCGRYFASIRCPSCGFTGDEGLFDQGCPICGYAARQDPVRTKPPRQDPARDGLPRWIYLLTFMIFLAAAAAFFVTLTGG
jgi:hypothetical protein